MFLIFKNKNNNLYIKCNNFYIKNTKNNIKLLLFLVGFENSKFVKIEKQRKVFKSNFEVSTG